MRAARNNSAHHPPKAVIRDSASELPATQDRSEALKRYLFGTPHAGEAGKNVNGSTFGGSAGTASTALSFGAPLVPASIPPPGQPKSEEVRDEGVIAMEDNLRRLLKLDSPIRPRHPVQQP
jgi:hypothetical protein